MNLKGFDLDQVELEAKAIEKHRKHELSRGRKPPDDDTIRIPVALLLALLEKVQPPKPSKYVRPGTYCGMVSQPAPMSSEFTAEAIDTVFGSNPCNVSADALTDPPPGGYHPMLPEHLGITDPVLFDPLGNFSIVTDEDAVLNVGAGEVTVVPGHYSFTTTVNALHNCNLHFPLTDVSPHPLVVNPQEGTVTHNGRVVGKVPVDSTGTVNINSLTATCRMEHSMGCVVVEDVQVK